MEGIWIPCFFRHLNDWEFEELERFSTVRQGKKVVIGKEDALALKGTEAGTVTIKAFYKLLDCNYTSPFHSSLIWNSCVPSKVGFIFFFV